MCSQFGVASPVAGLRRAPVDSLQSAGVRRNQSDATCRTNRMPNLLIGILFNGRTSPYHSHQHPQTLPVRMSHNFGDDMLNIHPTGARIRSNALIVLPSKLHTVTGETSAEFGKCVVRRRAVKCPLQRVVRGKSCVDSQVSNGGSDRHPVR